jgi:hypothetical protein
MAEGVGFEPTVRFPVRLISSQVPSTAQPPFLCEAEEHSEKVTVVEGKGSEASGRNGERARSRGPICRISRIGPIRVPLFSGYRYNTSDTPRARIEDENDDEDEHED